MIVKTLQGGAWIALLVFLLHRPTLGRGHQRGQEGIERHPLNEGPDDPLAEVPHYDFEYIVRNDPDGQLYGAAENRAGDSTSGYYFVDLPDGRRQKVSYYVTPESGYVAEISYEQINDVGEDVSGDGRVIHQPRIDHGLSDSETRITLTAPSEVSAKPSPSRGHLRGSDVQIQPFLGENHSSRDHKTSEFSVVSESRSVSSQDVADTRQTQRPGTAGRIEAHRAETGRGISPTGIPLPIFNTNRQRPRNFFWKSNRKPTANHKVQSSSSLSSISSAGFGKSSDAVEFRASGLPRKQVDGRKSRANIHGIIGEPIHHRNTNRRKGARIGEEESQHQNAHQENNLAEERGYSVSQLAHTNNIDARITDGVRSQLAKPFSTVKTIVRPLGRNRSIVIGNPVPDFFSAKGSNTNVHHQNQKPNFKSSSDRYGGKVYHSLAPNAYYSSFQPTSSKHPLVIQQQATFRESNINSGTARSNGTQNIFDYDSFIKSLNPDEIGRRASKIPHSREESKYFENDQSLSVSRLREISAVSLPENPAIIDGESASKSGSRFGFGPPRPDSLYTYPPRHDGFKPMFVSAQPPRTENRRVQSEARPTVVKLAPTPEFKPSPRIGVPLPEVRFPSSDRLTLSDINVGIPLPSKRLNGRNKSFSFTLNGREPSASAFKPSVNRVVSRGNFGRRISPAKLLHRERMLHTTDRSQISSPKAKTIADRKSSPNIRVTIPATTTKTEQRRVPSSTLGSLRPRLEVRPGRKLQDFENIGVRLPAVNSLPAPRKQDTSEKFQIQPPLTRMVPPPEQNRPFGVGIPLPIFQSTSADNFKGTRSRGTSFAAPNFAPSFAIRPEDGKTSVGQFLPSDSSVLGRSQVKPKSPRFDERKLFVQQLEPVGQARLEGGNEVPKIPTVRGNLQRRRNFNVAKSETRDGVGISLPDIMLPPPAFRAGDEPFDSRETGATFAGSSEQPQPRSSSTLARPSDRLDDSVFLEEENSRHTRFGFNIQAGVGPHGLRRSSAKSPVFPPVL